MLTIEKDIYYQLVNKEGRVLNVERSTTNGYYCGEHQYTLTTSPVEDYDDVFPLHFTTLEYAELAILVDTPWFNSSENRPTHGRINIEDFRPVLVTREVRMDIEEVMNRETIHHFGYYMKAIIDSNKIKPEREWKNLYNSYVSMYVLKTYCKPLEIGQKVYRNYQRPGVILTIKEEDEDTLLILIGNPVSIPVDNNTED
jgi:hypothetical protein